MDNQATLGNHGAKYIVQHNGKTYKLGFRTRKVMAELERWYKQNRVRDLVALKGLLAEADYSRELSRLLDELREITPSRMRLLIQEAANSPEGLLAYTRALLEGGDQIGDDEFNVLVAEKWDEIQPILELIMGKVTAAVESVPKLKNADGTEGDPDPKQLARAMKEAGFPVL